MKLINTVETQLVHRKEEDCMNCHLKSPGRRPDIYHSFHPDGRTSVTAYVVNE
jgi:hypothetical protein